MAAGAAPRDETEVARSSHHRQVQDDPIQYLLEGSGQRLSPAVAV